MAQFLEPTRITLDELHATSGEAICKSYPEGMREVTLVSPASSENKHSCLDRGVIFLCLRIALLFCDVKNILV